MPLDVTSDDQLVDHIAKRLQGLGLEADLDRIRRVLWRRTRGGLNPVGTAPGAVVELGDEVARSITIALRAEVPRQRASLRLVSYDQHAGR